MLCDNLKFYTGPTLWRSERCHKVTKDTSPIYIYIYYN